MQWARPETCVGLHGMPLTLRARPGPSRTSPRTNSVRPPTRSRPHVLRRRKARARPQDALSAGGSVTRSQRRFASSYLTTSGYRPGAPPESSFIDPGVGTAQEPDAGPSAGQVPRVTLDERPRHYRLVPRTRLVAAPTGAPARALPRSPAAGRAARRPPDRARLQPVPQRQRSPDGNASRDAGGRVARRSLRI